jgi:hypothetical protein
MSVQIKGLDEVQRKLRQISDNAKKLQGEHQISFEVLFNNRFMEKYTDTSSIEEFLERSGFVINSQEDFEKIPNEEFDIYVQKNTQFSSWEEMLQEATGEYVSKQLGF